MKTPAQRQAERRARLKASDLVEVRGLYLPLHLHTALKRYAEKMQPLPEMPFTEKQTADANLSPI